jgi:hypothetical protein
VLSCPFHSVCFYAASQQAPNIYDIAKRAGVSITTGPRILNTPDKVNNPQTRARWQAEKQAISDLRALKERLEQTHTEMERPPTWRKPPACATANCAKWRSKSAPPFFANAAASQLHGSLYFTHPLLNTPFTSL